MRDDQTVAEMANEVLLRQAKARADRNGEPIEAAMKVVVGTEAGRQLAGLTDGPHGDEGVEGGRWASRGGGPGSGRGPSAGVVEEVPGHPTHGRRGDHSGTPRGPSSGKGPSARSGE